MKRSLTILTAGGKEGSSHITGERGLNLDEEIFLVSESVGHSLDDLNAVVHAFDNPGV